LCFGLFFKYRSWKNGALAVVNPGGDSDTAGAIYGGLAGAYFGLEAITAEWVEGMQRREQIEEIASGLAKLTTDTPST
jgi:ADP-ribosylglycohydrolase